ncbi:GNAT family N-acetyltransferase [Limibaculum sp. M0105]|uniref:GNAT family N-acetyltransferase n=1 Tax=Thermohalobaculum xanthum TaxID=2753746 RepID=A0A8J7SFT1_9RHOB|nr:N-acetyltransferase [Thermohalobaculum xanthum]MBK0399732.1 GNAT family N-acetyltransferase [Thermohalobaculum xanthum]
MPLCRGAGQTSPTGGQDVTIRPAEPDDVARIAVIAEAAFAPYIARIGRRPAPMDDDFVADVAARKVLVAGRPALGYAISWAAGGGWHLSAVAVDPEVAGRGIGRSLIAAVEAMARESGASAIELYTHAAMTENRALYPRLGYRVTGERTEDGFRRVFFRKVLTGPEIPG